MNNDFQPVVGRRFYWNGVLDSDVVVLHPQKTLSYSWNALGLESVVVWTLTATQSGTLLRMEQSGFGDDQMPTSGALLIAGKKF